jgi:serine/threonine protein kinase
VNDDHDACLTDFGLARTLETSGFTTESVCGTCRWMAYELIAPCEEEEESVPRVTVATDIWAFGMTVLEVGSSLPFHHRSDAFWALISDLERGITIFSTQVRHGCYALCH